MKRYYLLYDIQSGISGLKTPSYKRIFVEENGKCADLYICDLEDKGTYTSYDHEEKSQMSLKDYDRRYWKVKELTENEAFVELI